MRCNDLVRLITLIFIASVVSPARAAPNAISRSADGRDIIAHCLPHFIADFRTNGRVPPASPSEDDVAKWIRIFDYPDHFNSITALEAEIAFFRPKVRNGEGVSVVLCASERRLQQLKGRVSTSHEQRSIAPATHPAPKPAPAEKLPLARAAKITAPWSPEAMHTLDAADKISAKMAPERADALASCRIPLEKFAAEYGETITSLILIVEPNWLADEHMQLTEDQLRYKTDYIEKNAESLGVHVARAGACVYKRRLAQLEGSPLISGAIDGSLNPMTIGASDSTWKPQGKDARIIASDGKSAMDCVKLVTLASKDSNMGTGGRVISNQCAGRVEITWCYTDTECANNRGAAWTVGAGDSWPVSAEREIRWAACHGRNTVSFVKGTAGLRYYCSAPAKE